MECRDMYNVAIFQFFLRIDGMNRKKAFINSKNKYKRSINIYIDSQNGIR